MVETKIKISDTELTLVRLNLKGWTLLGGLGKQMEEAVSKQDYTEYYLSTVRFIETASFPIIDWTKVSWFDLLEVYSKVIEVNKPSLEFSILRGEKNKEKKKLPWEYDGRSWFYWFNLFASNYGWTENQIEHLDIDTALGLYQEIEIDNQLGREWYWGLSEKSSRYEPSTKKSIFVPLDRPSWMKPIIPKQLPIVRMRKDMLPIGVIVSWGGESKKSGI